MIPMFSTLWKASRRLRSCCWSAYSTPSTAEVEPSASTAHPQEEGSGPAAGARMSKPKRRMP
jgi:hypothetical protein